MSKDGFDVARRSYRRRQLLLLSAVRQPQGVFEKSGSIKHVDEGRDRRERSQAVHQPSHSDLQHYGSMWIDIGLTELLTKANGLITH